MEKEDVGKHVEIVEIEIFRWAWGAMSLKLLDFSYFLQYIILSLGFYLGTEG